ncbi:hypothetical protein RhiJN_27699 [Ceratobasidium sp. AG-Ba]|nr:hypothetical protein RhiJN_27699 [Ceratobasidium sp. AG-Ba]
MPHPDHDSDYDDYLEFQRWKAAMAKAKASRITGDKLDAEPPSSDARISASTKASDHKPRRRSNQKRQLASFQRDEERNALAVRSDSESPAPQYRAKIIPQGHGVSCTRRRVESLPPSQLDNTPHATPTSHTSRRRSPSLHLNGNHAQRNQSNPPSPSLASPREVPVPRSASLTAPDVHCHNHSPPRPEAPLPSRDPSPGAGPWPYSRDASPERPIDGPSDEAGEPTIEADSDEPAVKANLNVPAVDDPNPYDYPYDNTPTSRVAREVDGKRARSGRANKTHIEMLGDRLSKHQYTEQRIHPFAIKKGISWFNPYSAIKAPLECYELVKKPPELVTGPGRGGTQLHELAGLRSDLDFWNVIRRVTREGLARYAPRNLQPDVRPTWSRYSASAQREVYRYCYRLIPSLQHFRNKTGEDCWLIAAIAQQYLQGKNPNLTVTKKFPPKIAQDIEPDLAKYDDDYSANARKYTRGSSPLSETACIPAPHPPARAMVPRAPGNASRAAPRATGRVDHSHEHDRSVDHSRGRPAPQQVGPVHPDLTTNSRAPAAGPRHAPHPAVVDTPDDKPVPAPHSNSRTRDLPPTTTQRQNRKADKKVAAEEALADASKARVSAEARAAPRPIAKQHAPSGPVLAVDEESEESDEDAGTRKIMLKIKPTAREHARAKPSAGETEEESASMASKKTRKEAQPSKTVGKAPAKPQASSTKAQGKRKANEELEDDEASIVTKRGKTTEVANTLKRKGENQDEETENPPKKKQARPVMRPAPSESQLESESPYPPASLIASTANPPQNNKQAHPDDVPMPGPSRTATNETSEDQCSGEPSKSATDQTSGLRIVGTSKIKIARPVKQVAPSDRKLRTRG